MIKLDEAQIALEQAQTYWKNRQWRLTIETCAKALALNQQLAEAHKLMGDALQKTGKIQEAIGYYQQAIAIQPDFAKVYVNLGSLHANQQQWSQAVDYYQEALKYDPELLPVHQHLARILAKQPITSLSSANSLEEYLHRGRVFQQQGKWESALKEYQQAVQLAPNRVEPYRELANLCEKLGQWQDAAKYCRLVLQLSGLARELPHLEIQPRAIVMQKQEIGEAQGYLAAAENSLQQQKYQEAVTYYRQAIAQQPDFVPAYLGWAKLLTRGGATKKAIACYLQGLKQVPDSAELYFHLGHLYQLDSKWSQATVCYQKAVQHDPKYSHAYHELGEVLSKQEQWSDAIAAYRQAIALNPDFSWSYNNLGYALIQVGQWRDAVPVYKQAIALNPEFPWSYYNLAEAYGMLSNWSDAVAYYEQAAQIQADLPQIEHKLGHALYQRCQSDRSRALEHFSLAIAREPDNPQVYHQALAIDRTNIELYLKLANILLEKGELDEAIVTYQMALQVQPSNSLVLARLQETMQKKTAIAF